MSEIDFIFTVTAGRSGQAALTEILRRHVPACYAAFEEPNIKKQLPGVLGDWERILRRRFIETHELLGRGQVLEAFENEDIDYLKRIANLRIKTARRQLLKYEANVYFDVSKYFARGLHVGFANILPSFALVRLVRDPLLNMRSFLNRNKNFRLDNTMPNSSRNLLQMEFKDLESGELYLWSWCEMYLRFDKLVEDYNVKRFVEIRTEELSKPDLINSALDSLGLSHSPVIAQQPVNTNLALGLAETLVKRKDVDLFEKFLGRLKPEQKHRISYLENYDPTKQLHNMSE